MILGFLSFCFSAQDNVSVAPDSSGGEPVDRAAEEEAESGTESCRNSSQEPEEPGKDRAPTGFERCEMAALSRLGASWYLEFKSCTGTSCLSPALHASPEALALSPLPWQESRE